MYAIITNDNDKKQNRTDGKFMNILNIQDVSLDLGDRMLFEHISFGVQDQDKIGIVGVNGSGKSTILKMIAGVKEVEEGEIIKANHIKIGYLPQTPEFAKDDTILSYVLGDTMQQEMWNNETDAKLMLQELGITDVTQNVHTLSGGQQKRVALARTLLLPSELLILDEPTNHLDSGMIEWLENYLKNYKGALLMVTHDRYFLDSVTNKILEMDRSKVYEYESNYSGYLELKAQREESEQATYDKSRNLYRNELKWVRRGARARSTKQKARLQRFEELKTMVKPEKIGSVQLESIVSRMGKKTIELKHLAKSFGDKVVIDDFSYHFLKEQNVGFVGHNGCGKSTLLNMIVGALRPDSGEIDIGETIKIGYFSQTCEDMPEDMKVIDYVKEIAEYLHTPSGTISASAMCERFLFDPVMQYALVGKLSGGERRRLYLLRVLMSEPNVLVLDEPTNDLDIATLNVLENYLDHFNGIVIVVSHDRYFLDRIVDRIFAFEGIGKLKQYEGGYTDYYLKKTGTLIDGYFDLEDGSGKAVASTMTEEMKLEKQKNQDAYKEEKAKMRKLKFTYQEQKEYDSIEDDIAALEEKIEALDQEMVKKATSYGELAQLTKEKEAVEAELEERYARWEYLSELAEKIANQE